MKLVQRVAAASVLLLSAHAAASGQGTIAPMKIGPAVRGVTRSPQECINVYGPAKDTPADSAFTPPVAKQMIIPPFDLLSALQGWTFAAQWLVGATGSVDSVGLVGVESVKIAAALRKAMSGYRFNPAVYQGCAVRAWSDPFSLTAGGGAPRGSPPVS